MTDDFTDDARNAGLVGYDEEVAVVVRSLGGREQAGAVIIGGPEVGKTRVANTALARMGDSTPVLRFVGSDYLADQPYGIFALLLAEEPDPLPLSPLLVHPAVRRILRQRYPGARPVVFVDNGHLVDEQSVSLLVQLIRDRTVRMVMTTESMRAPLDLMARLWTEGLLRRAELRGLGRADSARLLGEILGAPVDFSTAGQVHAAAGGSPRLLRSLILAQRDAGTLVLADGVYVLSGNLDASGLADMGLERRLKRLPNHQRRIVELVVLAGALPMSVLESMADGSVVDELAQMRIVGISGGGDPIVRMAEPAGSERNFWSIQPARRRGLWDECIGHVDFERLPPESLVGFAKWAMHVGGELDARQVTLASRAANDLWMMSRNIELYDHYEHTAPAFKAEVVCSCLELGWFERADALMSELASGPIIEDPEVLSRLRELELRLAAPAQVTEVWALPGGRAFTLAQRGRVAIAEVDLALREGDFRRAEGLARALHENYDQDIRVRLRAGAQLGIALVARGDVPGGMGFLEQARLTMDHHELSAADAIESALDVFIGFYLAGALEHSHAVSVSPVSSFYPLPVPMAMGRLRRGRAAEARSVLGPTLAALPLRDPLGIRQLALAADRLGLALQGTATGPGDGVVKPRPYHWLFDFEARRLNLMAWAQHEREPASAALHDLAREALDRDAVTCALVALLHAVRYGRSEATDDLLEVASGVRSTMGELGRRYGRAVADEDHEALLAAAQLATEAGEVLFGHDIAEAVRLAATEAGDRGGARRARTLAGNTFRRMGATAPRTGVELNDLERRLAQGAAKGATSAELGSQVHLSPRTVEWHLSRIYRRLHVANRGELRTVVEEWG